jgi:ribose transport system ATP-binding protein
VATRPVDEVGGSRLVEMILGRKLETYRAAERGRQGELVLEVEGISGEGVDGASFSVSAGEILGLTGLLGSGHESVLGLSFGAHPSVTGTLRTRHRSMSQVTPKKAMAAGIAYAPAERRTRGAMADWTVRENVTLPALKPQGRTRRLGRRAESADAAQWLRRLNVKPADPEALFASLSGGNQQKVVIGRWLRCAPDVFLLDEPTIGVDAGAKIAIYQELRRAADAGAGVVIASSDAEELATVCSRVIVFGNGRIIQERSGPLTPDDIVAACMQPAAVDSGPDEPVITTTKGRQPFT